MKPTSDERAVLESLGFQEHTAKPGYFFTRAKPGDQWLVIDYREAPGATPPRIYAMEASGTPVPPQGLPRFPALAAWVGWKQGGPHPGAAAMPQTPTEEKSIGTWGTCPSCRKVAHLYPTNDGEVACGRCRPDAAKAALEPPGGPRPPASAAPAPPAREVAASVAPAPSLGDSVARDEPRPAGVAPRGPPPENAGGAEKNASTGRPPTRETRPPAPLAEARRQPTLGQPFPPARPNETPPRKTPEKPLAPQPAEIPEPEEVLAELPAATAASIEENLDIYIACSERLQGYFKPGAECPGWLFGIPFSEAVGALFRAVRDDLRNGRSDTTGRGGG